METHMIVFIAAAVFVNVLTYIGITLVYFNDKHRVDPPRPVAEVPEVLAASTHRERELAHAA